jgi:hypothetical protein
MGSRVSDGTDESITSSVKESTQAETDSVGRHFDRRSFMVRAAVVSSGIAATEAALVAEGSHSASASESIPVHVSRPLSTPAVVDLVAAKANGVGTTGIYAPSDWGQTGGWVAARMAAIKRQVNVVFLGDSVGEGYWSSDLLTKGFVGATINALRVVYGDGGSGFHSTIDTPGLAFGPTAATVYSTTGGVWGTLELG